MLGLKWIYGSKTDPGTTQWEKGCETIYWYVFVTVEPIIYTNAASTSLYWFIASYVFVFPTVRLIMTWKLQKLFSPYIGANQLIDWSLKWWWQMFTFRMMYLYSRFYGSICRVHTTYGKVNRSSIKIDIQEKTIAARTHIICAVNSGPWWGGIFFTKVHRCRKNR